MLASLEDEGVDTAWVVSDPESDTGAALVMVQTSGEKQILTAPGANHRLTDSDVTPAAPAIGAAKVLLIALETPTPSVTEAIRLAREGGTHIILDPARPAALPRELEEQLRHVHIIKPNASEAQALTGLDVHDRASARRAAEQLLRRGVGAVAIQAGDEGDLLVWVDGEQWLPRLPVASVDATGAGDAFAAALGVMMAEGRPLAEAGLFANAAAALTTTKLGAQAALPRRAEVEALLRRSPALAEREARR